MPSWAVIRPTWFAQNFTESFFRQPIEEQGLLVAPAGQGREPWIDATDIAAVAAVTLTRRELAGQVYELSGPEALDLAQTAEILGKAAGGTVTYIDADPAERQQGLVAAGVPQDYAGLLSGLMGLVRGGHDAHLSDGVQRPSGARPAALRSSRRPRPGKLRVGAAA